MQGATIQAPGLSTYLKSLKSTPVDASVEHFISWVSRLHSAQQPLTSMPGSSNDDRSETRDHAPSRRRPYFCA